MHNLFICPQGHRWQIDPDKGADTQQRGVCCPVCGAEAHTTSFQELKTKAREESLEPVAATASIDQFQDLGQTARDKLLPLNRRANETAFQELPGKAHETAFQEMPKQAADRDSTDFTPAPPRPPLPERSTAVTLRFPGLRREALVRPLPTIPDYDILDEVGHGPNSVVYRARESTSQRIVAIKVIVSGAYADGKNFPRLRARLEAASKLQHPCILRIHSVGIHQGQPHIIMEYVDSGDLRKQLGGRPQPPFQAAQLTETLARTVAFAHERDMVHLDLKTSNVLLSNDGLPKVSDFGLVARPDDADDRAGGGQGGDACYLAPEQLPAAREPGSGAPKIGPTADVYALGVIFYKALTGRLPFLGTTSGQTADLVQRAEPLPPGTLNTQIPRALETICLQCLRKDPLKRYLSAYDLAEDLHRFLLDQPINARPVGWLERAWKWSRQRPIAASILALLSIVLIVGCFTLLKDRSRLKTALQTESSQRAASEEQTAASRRSLYLADMNMALLAWQRGEVEQAIHLLGKNRAASDLRSFEWSYLWRLCHPEQLALVSQGSALNAIAFSPSGFNLAIGTAVEAGSNTSGEIRLYDMGLGKQWGSLKTETPVTALVYAPDNRTLITGTKGGVLQSWDLLTLKEVYKATFEQAAPITSLSLTADGKLLASASNGHVTLWQLAAGNTMRTRSTLPIQSETVTGLAFTHDGKRLAVAVQGDATKQGHIKILEVATGKELTTLRGHRGTVRCLLTSADGSTLISAGGGLDGRGEVKIWDSVTFQLRRDLDEAFEPVVAVALSPDSKTLAVAGGDHSIQLALLDGPTPTLVRLVGHNAPLSSVAFSADGKFLASSALDGSIKLWSLAAALGGSVLRGHKQPINALALATSAEGELLLASGGGETGKAGELKLWLTKTGEEQLSVEGQSREIRGVALSPDGKYLAAAGEDTQCKIFDWTEGRTVTVLKGHTHWVTSVAFAAKGNLVVTGSADALVKVWDPGRGGEIANLKGHVHPVLAVAFSPDGTLVASADAGHVVRIWNFRDHKEVARFTGHTAAVEALAFSPDGKLLATASADRTIKLCYLNTHKELATFSGHTRDVTSVAFAPDGKTLASGSRDGTVRLWDLVSGSPRAVLRGHTGWVQAVAFSPRGNILASAGSDKIIRLWQAATDQEVEATVGH